MSTKDISDRIGRIQILTNTLASELRQGNLFRTCINCTFWGENSSIKEEVCTKYDNKRPPAKVIAYGCPSHEDEIPF